MAFLRVAFVLLIVAGMVQAHRRCRCKRFWTQFRGNCYRLFAPKPWSQAEDHCKKLKFRNNYGHLASIHNAEENDFLRTMMESTTASNVVWLGGSDKAKEGKFVWSDGTPFRYCKWQPGEPNNGSSNQHCLSFWRVNGKIAWDDNQCYKSFPYICKIAAAK